MKRQEDEQTRRPQHRETKRQKGGKDKMTKWRIDDKTKRQKKTKRQTG